MQVQLEKVTDKSQEMAIIKVVEETAEIKNAVELLEGGMAGIPVIKDGTTVLCKLSAVYYFESVDKKTFVYTKDECYETKYRLYEIEEMSYPYFARCSKAMIVNLKKVRQVSSELGARMNAQLLNGESLVVARSYVKDIKRRLDI